MQEMLKQYRFLEKEIKRLERKIEYYIKHPLKMEHGVVQSSMKSYPYAPTHLVISGTDAKSDEERQRKIKQLVVELYARKEEYEKLQLDIDIAIEKIDDIEMRNIIHMKYRENMTDDAIASELGYERSTICKKIQNFTQFTFCI